MTTEEVLYVARSGSGSYIYYIFLLTYSTDNPEGFPKYKEFKDICAVKSMYSRR